MKLRTHSAFRSRSAETPSGVVVVILAFVLSVAPARHHSIAATSAGPAAREVTILYTGDTRGWVEPCGCSQGVLGGLPRRATLLKRLGEQTPDALIVDTGALLGESSDELKVPLIVERLKAMSYAAANLGVADFRWREQLAREMEKNGLAGISLQYGDAWAIQAQRVAAAGEVRVGLVGVAAYPGRAQMSKLKCEGGVPRLP